MKASRLSTVLLIAALSLPVAALAGAMTKESLHLFETVRVQGKALSPGDYHVEWNGAGPNVKVDIVQGRDTLATVPAKIVTESTKSEQDGYTLKKEHGNQELTSIFFSGKDFTVQIPEPGSSASASRASGGY
jgi:hypothetical protein